MHYSPINFVFLQTNIKKPKKTMKPKNHDDFHEIKPQNNEIHRSFTDVYLLSHCAEHDGAARKTFSIQTTSFRATLPLRCSRIQMVSFGLPPVTA